MPALRRLIAGRISHQSNSPKLAGTSSRPPTRRARWKVKSEIQLYGAQTDARLIDEFPNTSRYHDAAARLMADEANTMRVCFVIQYETFDINLFHFRTGALWVVCSGSTPFESNCRRLAGDFQFKKVCSLNFDFKRKNHRLFKFCLTAFSLP